MLRSDSNIYIIAIHYKMMEWNLICVSFCLWRRLVSRGIHGQVFLASETLTPIKETKPRILAEQRYAEGNQHIMT